MTEALAKFLAAYLIGTVMGGHVIGALRGGVDLRKFGSGNVGATNALRTQGSGFALGVLAIDVLKGVAAALLVPLLPWPWEQAQPLPREHLGYLCGIGAALGHCYPVFYRFQGGKGVATLAGVFGALLPPVLPWMLGVFAGITILTGFVALASVGAAVTALFYVACFDDRTIWSAAGAFTLAMTTLVVWKHRLNLVRIARGEEHRFDKAMLLHRWLRR
ncbi:MAG TPA: glycerol-3-phosphate 1-O-acyltransferase PlsY [Solimonas sp.]|nr:glycerol-3-phosphate 1-O-acyltransferase PlsY [Solimonas sp.]